MIRRPLALAAVLIMLAAISVVSRTGNAGAALGPLIAGGPAGPPTPGLYAYSLTTGAIRSITALNALNDVPLYAWSPDSKKMAVAPNDADTGGGGIQVIDVASGNATVVLAPADGQANSLRWSPDGSQLAFIFSASIASGSQVSSALRIWSVASSSLRTLVPNLASLPVWTPDGKGITIAIGDSSQDPNSSNARIVTLDAASGSTTQTILTTPVAICQVGLAWSPDESYLAYGGTGFHQGCLPGKLGLFTWNAATGTTTQLFDGTAEAPIWLPDGTVLDEVASLGGQTGLLSISLRSFRPDGSSQQTLASDIPNDFPPANPPFQAAGGEIMYATASCSGADVTVIDPGSTQPRRLSAGSMYAIGAHLSPDGRTVAWTAAGSDANFLALAPVSGAAVPVAFSGSPGVVPGDFSPDGQWIAFGIVPSAFDPCSSP